MGGLAPKIPTTYWTFLIATLAIAGIPLLAGFFSKDAILAAVFDAQFDGAPWLPRVLWAVGALHRGPDRLLHVPARLPDVLGHLPRHAGAGRRTSTSRRASMTVPLDGPRRSCRSSAATSAIPIVARRRPDRRVPRARSSCRSRARRRRRARAPRRRSSSLLMARRPSRSPRSASSSPASGTRRATGAVAGAARARLRPASTGRSSNKYYVDEVYDAVFVEGLAQGRRPLPVGLRRARSSTDRRQRRRGTSRSGVSWVSSLFDQYVVDGLVNGVANTLQAGVPRLFRRAQTGRVQNYALVMGGGLFCLVAVYLLFR